MIKEQIADAFQRHFHQFGFKKTSVDDVAREMKISKKTIYQQFSSKEEILQYIIQLNAGIILNQMMAHLSLQTDENAKLTELIRLIHRLAREFHRSNTAFELQFRLDIAEAAYHKAYSKILNDLIKTGVENGEFYCVDVPTVIHFVVLIVSESLRLSFDRPENSPEEETIRIVQKILS